MSDGTSQEIYDVFVNPIKNVLVIDDRFPTHNEYPRNDKSLIDYSKWDIDKATKVFNFFHKNLGKPCSFANDAAYVLQKEIPSLLDNTDLLVLDYDLGGIENSLKILNKISTSPNFNLVIVYSIDATDEVSVNKIILSIISNIALYNFKPHDHAKEFSIICEEYAELVDKITVEDAIKLLCKEKLTLTPFGQYIDIDHQRYTKEIVTHAIEEKFIETERVNGVTKFYDRKISYQLGKNPYIKGDSFFITITGKRDTEPEELMTRLKDSLSQWSPGAVELTLYKLLNELKVNAPKHVNSVLKNENLTRGWLYHSRNNHSDLINHLMGELSAQVCNNLTIDTEEVMPNEDVIHALNCYLGTYSQLIANNLTTGIVLYGEDEYWIVLNCSCDLVPEQKTLYWKKTTDPWQPFTAVKLTKSTSIKKYLINATRGNGFFINHCGINIYLMYAEADKNPHYEIMFAEDKGVFCEDGGKSIKALRVIINNSNKSSLEMKSIKFDVIAQLRYEYACRFLQMLTAHKGRVGVDFVNLPGEKSSAPE